MTDKQLSEKYSSGGENLLSIMSAQKQILAFQNIPVVVAFKKKLRVEIMQTCPTTAEIQRKEKTHK